MLFVHYFSILSKFFTLGWLQSVTFISEKRKSRSLSTNNRKYTKNVHEFLPHTHILCLGLCPWACSKFFSLSVPCNYRRISITIKNSSNAQVLIVLTVFHYFSPLSLNLTLRKLFRKKFYSYRICKFRNFLNFLQYQKIIFQINWFRYQANKSKKVKYFLKSYRKWSEFFVSSYIL